MLLHPPGASNSKAPPITPQAPELKPKQLRKGREGAKYDASAGGKAAGNAPKPADIAAKAVANGAGGADDGAADSAGLKGEQHAGQLPAEAVSSPKSDRNKASPKKDSPTKDLVAQLEDAKFPKAVKSPQLKVLWPQTARIYALAGALDAVSTPFSHSTAACLLSVTLMRITLQHAHGASHGLVAPFLLCRPAMGISIFVEARFTQRALLLCPQEEAAPRKVPRAHAQAKRIHHRVRCYDLSIPSDPCVNCPRLHTLPPSAPAFSRRHCLRICSNWLAHGAC